MKKTSIMKKITGAFMVMTLSMSLITGCGSKSNKTLKVYNAGEYIDTELIHDFEKEFDCKVVYETFDSNESMYTKVQSGEKYDVIIPSDYMIERLIKEDALQKIDWSLIPNAEGLDENVLGLACDPNNEYSVPYFYGNVGILYDKTVVDEADLKDGWEILRNEKYKGAWIFYEYYR